MDFNKFVRYFITDDADPQPDSEGAAIGSEVTDDFNGTADPSVSLQVVDEEKVLDGGSLTSADSGIIDTVSKGRFLSRLKAYLSYVKCAINLFIIKMLT